MNVDWLTMVGAGLLVASTLPQAWKLLRTRDASSFSLGFCSLNAIGLSLFLWRSIQIQEVAFIITNGVTTAFWAGLMVFKLLDRPVKAPEVTLRPAVKAPAEQPLSPPSR
ncbi:MAG TPA: PQ-loop domain-containing transporter [Candidatus Thermoplasmatota archaeon]|nr:PQ-loop domain-containing transporter [Candidatus Thermoplasmatota archaeon]